MLFMFFCQKPFRTSSLQLASITPRSKITQFLLTSQFYNTGLSILRVDTKRGHLHSLQ